MYYVLYQEPIKRERAPDYMYVIICIYVGNYVFMYVYTHVHVYVYTCICML